MLIIGQQLLIECVCLDYIGWKRCCFPESLGQRLALNSLNVASSAKRRHARLHFSTITPSEKRAFEESSVRNSSRCDRRINQVFNRLRLLPRDQLFA